MEEEELEFREGGVSRSSVIVELQGIKSSTQKNIRKLRENLKEHKLQDQIVERIGNEAIQLEGIDNMNMKVLGSAYTFLERNPGQELTPSQFENIDDLIEGFLPKGGAESVEESIRNKTLAKATLIRYIFRILETRRV